MTEPESNRAQLTEQIIEGNVDLMLIATVLVKEVLPALDHISKQIAYRLVLAEMAMAQIGVIYEHLQDLAPSRKTALLAQERLRWQERLERALAYLEGKAKQ